MSPSTVPLARLTTLSLMFVLPLMALPAQGAQTHTPPGGMMIAPRHSNSNARQHGAVRRAHAWRPGLHAHVTTTYTINPAISLTPSAGAGGSSITIRVDGSPVSTDCKADASGSFSACAFTVPAETGGTHTVTASDHIANSASAIYTASAFARSTISASSAQATNTGDNPAIRLSSSAGTVGSKIAVNGSGFAAYGTITLTFDGGSVATDCKANANGSFRYCVLTIPAAIAGTHTVTASDGNANSASTGYTVNPALSLTPRAGVAGSSAAVSGRGYSPYRPITVTFDGSSVATDCITNANGSFRYCAFTVPAAPAGPHTVTASDSRTNVAVASVRFFHSASASFTVTPVISLNPAAGTVGSTVTLSGSNFEASSSLTVTFDGTPLSTSGTCTADDKGNLATTNNCTFTVPAAPAGPHTVTASNGTDSDSATFTVNAAISLTSSAGPVGSSVAVNGSGFAPYSTIALTFDGKSVVTDCTTDATGSFSACAFTVPAVTAGPHTVTASNGSENSASASFTANPVISLTPSAGVVGSAVTLSGSNFKPGSSITVMFDGTKLSTCTADDSGNLPTKNACAFTVPAATAGIYTVTASDTSANSAAARLTVIPAIILTASAGAVGSRAAVSGSGFKANAPITVTFDGSSVATSCTTDATGSFGSCAFTVPAAAAGPHTVRATDSSGNFAWVRFTV